MKKDRIEELREEISKLENEIEKIKEQRDNCTHEWGEIECEKVTRPIYDIVTYGMLSDTYSKYVPTGKFETVDVYSRCCKKCGYIDCTSSVEEVPVQVKKVPKFRG